MQQEWFKRWPRPRLFEWIALGLELAGVALFVSLVVFQQSGVATTKSTYEFLFGGRGLLELAISASTFVAGVVTVVLLFRRADADRAQIRLAEENGRFIQYKEAATLLANDRQSANVNGMVMLAALVGQRPDRFMVPVARALAIFLHEKTQETWRTFAVAIQDKTALPAHISSSQAVITGLSIIGSLRQSSQSWPTQLARVSGNMRLEQIYIADVTFKWLDLSKCELVDWIAYRLSFEDCSLAGTEMDITTDDTMSFTDCDLTGLKLSVLNSKRQTHFPIAVTRCKVDGAIINGIPIANSA